MNFLLSLSVRSVVICALSASAFGATSFAQEGQLTLTRALDRARQRAPVILAAKGRIEEARGKLAGALVRFRDNPLVELDAGPRFLPEGRLAAVDVGVSQNFELGGRRNARIAGAEAGIRKEAASSEDATRGLLRDVGVAFTRALWSQKRLELLRSSERLATEFLESARKRFEAGDIAMLDVNLAKTSSARARLEVRNATADYNEALGELRVFLGMGPEEPLSIRGDDFMPKLDEGALLIQTLVSPEASLDEVDRVNHRIEDALREFPEVDDVVRRSGRAERTEDPMPHTLSDVLVVLKRTRARDSDKLVTAMRERLATVPGATVLFTTPLGMRIDEGLGGTPADISVRLFGPDLQELARLAEQARAAMTNIKGIADLRVEKSTDMPQLRIAIDRAAVARVGLTPGDVIQAIRVGLAGQEVSEVWVGQKRFDLVVRLQDQARNDLSALRNLLIDGHDRTRIPLGQLAAVEESTGPGAIRREASTRRIAIEASVTERDLGSTADAVQTQLTKSLTLATGYFFDVGGKVESQKRASRSLAIAIGTSLLGVSLLLYLALGSTMDSLLIVATLPVAFVGSIVALLLSGGTWNVSSLVGLIGLFGIAVQNGLVLITQTRALVAEGRSFEEAIREASIGRVRPKIMTAATAIFGLLPILVLRLHGTEVERPLAVVMTGGLVTSTLFTLLVLPAFYLLVHRWKQSGAISWQRGKG